MNGFCHAGPLAGGIDRVAFHDDAGGGFFLSRVVEHALAAFRPGLEGAARA